MIFHQCHQLHYCCIMQNFLLPDWLNNGAYTQNFLWYLLASQPSFHSIEINIRIFWMILWNDDTIPIEKTWHNYECNSNITSEKFGTVVSSIGLSVVPSWLSSKCLQMNYFKKIFFSVALKYDLNHQRIKQYQKDNTF